MTGCRTFTGVGAVTTPLRLLDVWDPPWSAATDEILVCLSNRQSGYLYDRVFCPPTEVSL